MAPLSLQEVNHLVLCKHHLTADTLADDIVQVTRDIVGLHATIATSPFLSLYARMGTFRRSQLVEELEVLRTLGKVRWARKTVYVLPKDALPFAFAAMRVPLDERFGGYLPRMGTSVEEYEARRVDILALLKGRELTTGEIRKELEDDTRTSAFVNLMCDEGSVIRCLPRTGWKGNLHTYRLLSEVFPDLDLDSTGEEEGTRFLVSEYLRAFSPATRKDVVWWSGLPASRVETALSSMSDRWRWDTVEGIPRECIVLDIDRAALRDMEVPRRPAVSLLPALDPYVMGYKVRERMLDPAFNDHVIDPSGNVVQSIIVDGRIVGVWDLEEGKDPVVLLHFLEKVAKDVQRRIRTRAGALGRFITDSDAQVREQEEMAPLSERTRGSFMRPLRSS